MDSEPILKKTLVTVGAMVGAWVAFVGTVSLVAVVVTSHVVGSAGGAGDTNGTTVVPGARPPIDPLHTPALVRPPNEHRAQHDTI
jgi:hypothetical protein